jgi:CDGSH-type Zn-finger protein
MSDKVEITVIPQGPYQVRGARAIRVKGNTAPAEGDVYLCRCGNSANAPYCDGTHRKGFDDHCDPVQAKPVKVWEGKTVRTRFDPNVCMHVFYCKPLADLRERELAGDTGAAAAIAQVVSTCPSGALQWEAKSAIAAPSAPDAPAVEVMVGGEIRLHAPFSIDVPLRDGQPEDRATLCRCGMSKSKPWCDGRHKGRKGFQ